MRGVIVKAISGFYYVLCGEELLECKARGVFKKRGITPLVGDVAEVRRDADGSCTVTDIGPRLNSFERPPAANVQTLIIVTAAKDPDPAPVILDRLAVTAESAGAQAAICVNKIDIAPAETVGMLRSAYEGVYPVFPVSAATGEGVDALRGFLRGKQAALAGPSGVGKSTLANALLGRQASETGEISRKSLRGKNTTRHTELFSGDGFMLFDTPGFTSFDAVTIPGERLDMLFPEFAPYLGRCRFDDCAHIAEPDCEVRKALEAGKISAGRYASYLELYRIFKEQKKY